jgi:hypothetical protein
MKNKDSVIICILGVASIANAIRSILLTYERRVTSSAASIVAELGVALIFIILGGVFLIKYRKLLAELVRDRLVIFLVGLSTTAAVASYFVNHGLTKRVFLFQLPSIVLLGVIIGWYVRCGQASGHR